MVATLLNASTGLAVSLAFVGLFVGLIAGYFINVAIHSATQNKSRQSASKIIEKALNEAASVKKEAQIEAKEEAHKVRTELDTEVRERREEVKRQEQRTSQREESLVKREEILTNKELSIEATKSDIENTKRQCSKNLEEAKRKCDEAVVRHEKITGLSKVQAKKELMQTLVDEAKQEAAKDVRQIVLDAEEDAQKKAREVITNAVQKLSTDVISEITVSSIQLPSDEIKGRLIGREGRNIRAIEAATGVDLIIDDTPEAITISCFDPYRREIAKGALEKLISDGRIHPGRIEEVVERTKKELDTKMKEYGETMCYDLKVHGLSPELVKLVGRTKYRSSYGQSLYNHSKEVALLASHLATELGADEVICRRAGLLHDIGKVLDHETDGTHTQIGVDLAKKYKESAAVIHCIEAHHGDVPYNSLEAIIVQVADALSSTRPGARRENLENYVKRLRDLEEIADAKPGVEKSFAISAGREVRVIVKPDQVSDEQAIFLAKEIAKEVEEKLQYPGQIKVNVIREMRAQEYAK